MATDWITLGLGAATIAAVPLGSFAKKVYNDSTRLTVLETRYISMDQSLSDLKEGQKAQMEKLDRLVERLL